MRCSKCFRAALLSNLSREFLLFPGKSPATEAWFLDPSKEGELINLIHQQSYRAF